MLPRVTRARPLALLPLALALAACSAAAPEASISGPTLAERLGSDAPPLVLDVRTPEEYASGHVPGALNLPHDELGGRLPEIEGRRGDEVVVYCERGGRAAAAEDLLRRAGFSRVRHLEGDMSGWRSSSLPCAGC
jgi:rhodanese-related sulfurtransferase